MSGSNCSGKMKSGANVGTQPIPKGKKKAVTPVGKTGKKPIGKR